MKIPGVSTQNSIDPQFKSRVIVLFTVRQKKFSEIRYLQWMMTFQALSD